MTPYRSALNLAFWLYKVHPELYQQLLPLAQRAQGLGRLADGTTTFDTTDTFNPGFNDPGMTFDAISPDLASLATPDLSTITVDQSNFTTPNFLTESDPTGSIWSAISSGLSSVGTWLTTPTGLSTVGTVATKVFGANTPQQQTVQTQVQRTAAGSIAAPITYGVNPQGQVVPVLTSGNSGQGLSWQSLQKLLPTSLQKYSTPIAVGVLGFVLWGILKGRGRGR